MSFNSSALNDQNPEEGQGPLQTEINMTPLIDIMLVLLIIFMVTSSVSLDTGLDIDLPKTQSVRAKNENKSVLVSLDKSGGLFVQGKPVNYEQLFTAIQTALAAESANLVIFQGDENAKLGQAMAIMDTAKRAGAQKFAIAAEEQKSSK
ncbi:MAG: biopolymer transporter ExbD [Bdellovibrio sp.]|nr:biopolymer transporter ExbD [Bdellovibrio sp.]